MAGDSNSGGYATEASVATGTFLFLAAMLSSRGSTYKLDTSPLQAAPHLFLSLASDSSLWSQVIFLEISFAAKPEDPSAVPSSTSDPFAVPLSTTTEDPAAAPPSTLVEDVALGQARPPPKGGSGPHNNTDHT
ncbi:hypothetical protein CsSME_00014423 [Camellia sinensis var. sinensis]